MVRHHQRPRRERHELPGDKEGEGVVRQHDEVHAGEKGRVEGEHSSGCLLMLAVANGKKTRCCSSQVSHNEKKRGERIDAKVRTDPGQPERQSQQRWRASCIDEVGKRNSEDNEANTKAGSIDQAPGCKPSPRERGEQRYAK